VTEIAVTPFDLLYSRKPHATRRLHYSVFHRSGVIADRRFTLYIAEIGIFDLFGSYNLDFDRMAFIYELNPYSLEEYALLDM